MRFQEREITLKDGRKCILRPNGPDLAEPMLDYLKKTDIERYRELIAKLGLRK